MYSRVRTKIKVFSDKQFVFCFRSFLISIFQSSINHVIYTDLEPALCFCACRRRTRDEKINCYHRCEYMLEFIRSNWHIWTLGPWLRSGWVGRGGGGGGGEERERDGS